MKFFSANLEDLRALYTNKLQKALDMENNIVKALPTMVEKSTDPRLKQAFEKHLVESQEHVNKVERILDALGKNETITCKVIAALVSEAEDGIKDAGDESVRDVTLIGAAQQVEHHEIAVYGTLRSWAELLGFDDHAETLESILDEEKNADLTLSDISDSVNITAETTAYATAN